MRKYFVGLIGVVCTMMSYAPISLAITSNWIGPGSDYNTPSNWSAGVPAGVNTAGFNTATPSSIFLSNVGTLVDGFIFNSGASAYTLNIQNSGSLIFGGAGIQNNSGATQTIVNDGTLIFGNSADASDATIINNAGATLSLQQQSSLANANVINNGNMTLANYADPGIAVGSINGSGNIELGSKFMDIVNVGGMTSTFSGSISGAGGGLSFGSGILTLSGSNTYTGQTVISANGTLNLLGSLTSNVVVVGLGTLTGTGTLGALSNSATVKPGVNGIGTLTSSSYSGVGTLSIGFDGASHGKLRATGSANINGGSLLLTGTHFGVGQYSVLTANALAGTFSTFTSPTSSLLSFTTAYTPTDAFVRINFATAFLPFAQTDNQRSVAANLNGTKDSSTAEFTNAISSLSVLPAAQIPGVFNQISGDALASFQEVGLQNAAVFTKGMRQRAVNVSTNSYGLWAQGVGYVDDMDGDSSIGSPASHATTGGFQAGYDTFVSEDLLFGFSGGYAQTSLDVTDRASSGNTTTLQSGIYAHYIHEAWFANGAFGYTSETNDMTRPLSYSGINEQAKSNFNSRLYTTFVEAGYSYQQSKTLTLEPTLSLRQSHLSQDGFTETGAPGLGLTVADQSLNSFVSSLGLGLRRRFLEGSMHPLNLHASIAWEHELGNTANELSAQFAETSGGSPYTVQGTPRSRDAAALGLEGRVPLKTNFELFMNYTATLASVETMQKLFGGARFKW